MINILSLVSYSFLPARFGGQKAIAGLYSYLSKKAVLTCVTTVNNDGRQAPGYEVLNILSASPLRYINLFYFFTLRAIIREKKITHLLLEHPYYGWLGILLKKYTGVKLVIRSHNIEGLRWKTLGKWWWKLLWQYEKRVHRGADLSLFIQQEDLLYAVQQYGLNPQRCMVANYGTDLSAGPSLPEKQAARQYLQQQHHLPEGSAILLYNGSFDYLPNREGLLKIVQVINPLLQQQKFKYTLLICGKNIPEELTRQSLPGIQFAGFVEDISRYFKGSDVFLNPVIEGGGVKTKVVEALAYGTTVVSARSGATGIDTSSCGNKLIITDDDNWHTFAAAVMESAGASAPTPAAFYEQYYWQNITDRIIPVLNNL